MTHISKYRAPQHLVESSNQICVVTFVISRKIWYLWGYASNMRCSFCLLFRSKAAILLYNCDLALLLRKYDHNAYIGLNIIGTTILPHTAHSGHCLEHNYVYGFNTYIVFPTYTWVVITTALVLCRLVRKNVNIDNALLFVHCIVEVCSYTQYMIKCFYWLLIVL